MKLAVVILAAGQGKRMKSNLPKVLQPLAGKPLLQHVVSTARTLAPHSMHVVYGHGGEQVRATMQHEPLQWALQAEQKGTGHAVVQAMPAIADDEMVLVLYGDVPLVSAETLRALVALAGPKSLSLLTVMLADPTGYGRIVRNARGAVQRIVEQKDANKRELKIREGYSGILAVPAKLLRSWLGKLRNSNTQGEYYLTDVIAMAAKQKIKVTPLVAPTEHEVLGVNDKTQLAELEGHYRLQRARELMVAGATIIDPKRVDIRGEVHVGRDVVIEPNVLLEGTVHIGDRSRIGPNCVLRDMRIGADTVVHPNCVLERSEVGDACSVGPFARMRPDSKMERDAHIGNFVELKKTVLGPGSKANHLSYLGDAVIGAKVNVGAGSITCNYDGANKWVTTIEDGAFIGSGNMLVAPLTIGKDATTGAGSTITKGAPAGKLTVARGKQLTLEGWQRPVKQPKK
jgi:bifunctional UDP-N-acetylglucosamine pyrophosphorylase / glucosamine-1-phosphate N-acetyltransferase